MKSKFTIGYIHKGYPEERTIFLPWSTQKVRMKKCIDLFKLLDGFIFKFLGKSYAVIHNLCFFFIEYPFVDAYHFFNGIKLFGKKPWIVTYESLIPRLGSYDFINRFAVKQLTKDSCKAIIAISECAYHNQVCFLNDNYPDYAPLIIPKIKQLYPPQEIRFPVKFIKSERLKFVFVGRDFYQKGGAILLESFIEWKLENNIPAELIMISNLNNGFISDYSPALEENVLKWLSDESIIHHKSLPNKDVLLLLKDADVITLPTYADTFGYSVLEGMANACVPLVTNIRALTELVTPERGFMINLPIKKNGNLDRSIPFEEITFGAIMPQLMRRCRSSSR